MIYYSHQSKPPKLITFYRAKTQMEITTNKLETVILKGELFTYDELHAKDLFRYFDLFDKVKIPLHKTTKFKGEHRFEHR